MMTAAPKKTMLPRLAAGLPVAMLSLALITMPGYVPFAPDDHGAAFAKNGNGGGNGKGGNGKGAGKSQTGKGKPTTAPGKAKKLAMTTSTDGTTAPLHPSELGKWNASNANQAALDAHIRNGNFNGTIGALAQYQLAAKAASGAELTEEEMAALDSFIADSPIEISDQDLADFLNEGALDTDPVWSVEDGIVSCTANCDTADVDQAQSDVDGEIVRLADEQTQDALNDFYTASETRIIDESNKQLSPERTEDLLDELASRLGVTRPEIEEEDPLAGDPLPPEDDLAALPPLLPTDVSTD